MLNWGTINTTLKRSSPSNEVYIPERFKQKVIAHVLKVCLDLPSSYQAPLILTIQGPAGYGKSFQTRHVLDSIGVKYRIIDSAVLSGELEGDSIKPLMRDYISLGSESKISALIIDDFDMSIASLKENYERTSNSDILNTFLMHLCDNPKSVDGEFVHPVPIIITGNNFSKMYGPLLRHGRADLFEWNPEPHEKLVIIGNIFSECGIGDADLSRLINKYRDKNIAFFQQVKSSLIDKSINGLLELANNVELDRHKLVTLGRSKVKEVVRNTSIHEIMEIAVRIDVIAKDYT